jgi:hypothetical protein
MPWGTGIMECWNTGFGGMRSTLYRWPSLEIKIRTSSVSHTQYSIFPPFHYSMGYLTANTTPLGVKLNPDPLGRDSLLYEIFLHGETLNAREKNV